MYNPRIYIRDYGTPTRRLLAFDAGYRFEWSNVDLRRALIMPAENPTIGEEFLLLQGDAQSGSDVLDLSGAGNDLLVLTNDVAMRFFGSDVFLQYSNISGFPSWSYDLVAPEAVLRRDLFFRIEVTTFAQTMGQADLLRSVVMVADAGTFAQTGYVVDLRIGNILPIDAASFAVTASDAGLVRSLPMVATTAAFNWTGIAADLTRSVVMPAGGAAFTLTFNDANPSTDSIEALSGDADSGGDLMLLSGDAQGGTDFLLISQ